MAINQERIVAEFMELAAIDSPSRQEAAMAVAVRSKLEALGAVVEEDNAGQWIGAQGGNIIARIPGSIPGPILLFSAHLDTVEPAIGVKPVVRDGAIYSSGDTILGADDKAGIVAILEALRVLHEDKIPHGPIEVAFTICEEVGLEGAKLLPYDSLKATMAFVLDSSGPPGTIILRGPAQDKIEATIQGRAAHAGIAPEEGISAIKVAALAISRMRLGRVDHETTANIGVINGGKATNIIPEEVTIQGEARSLSEEKLQEQTFHMVKAFETAASEMGAKAQVVTETIYPAIDLFETDPVVQLALKGARRLGIKPSLKSTGGGSDANIMNGKGLPTVNLGIGMRQVHTTNEHITLEDLVLNARYVLEIIRVAAQG